MRHIGITKKNYFIITTVEPRLSGAMVGKSHTEK
jgi:hypothetical protein